MKGRKSKSWAMAYCGMAAALFNLSKTCPVTSIGGKDSVKGNR